MGKTKRDRDYDNDNEENTSDNENGLQKKRRYHIIMSNDPLIYSINNEVHFSTGVDTNSIENIIKEISTIISVNKKKYENPNDKFEITYVVDSPGGSVNSILKFVDFIKNIKKKFPNIMFRSVATGMVASAGTTMCVVADKRCMMPRAYAMIHELSTGNKGMYTHFMSYSEHLTDLHNTLVDVYMDNGFSGSRDELEVLLKNESWYNAKDYKDLGLIDEIL